MGHGSACWIWKFPPTLSKSWATRYARSLHPRLRDHPVEFRVELEIAEALRHEVDVLGVEHRCGRRLVGDRLVDLGPDLVGAVLIGHALGERGMHLSVDLLIAEA